jgi:hypothetical protein
MRIGRPNRVTGVAGHGLDLRREHEIVDDC